jgi:ribosome-binding ATPase YchF (GTP1/OBG family)
MFSPEERKELGLPESRLDLLIQKSYSLLRLITFLTTGEDETRAWTIREGTKAPQAAGVIHTDFEKKFIRADVIQWEKLLDAGGWTEARARGLVRSEGKEYTVRDGDVMEIKHS